MVQTEDWCLFFLSSCFLSLQVECLRNIMRDLAHYAAAFQSYINSPLRSPEQEVALLSPTLEMIQNLRKVCLICHVTIQRQKLRENVQGNNIWKLSHKIFLGLHRAAPCCRMKRTRQRYFFLSVYYSLITLREKTPRSFCVCVFVLFFYACLFSVVYQEDATLVWGDDTFNNRQEMCKMMRGFYTRTITINRAMGYISSGEHRE